MKKRWDEKRKAFSVVLLAILFIICGVGGAFIEGLWGHRLRPRPPQTLTSDFPAIHIYTRNAAPVRDRVTWVNATFHVRNADEEMTFESQGGRIRGRGNASWSMSNKTPYRIRFDSPRTMIGTEHAARDWVLIPNMSDKSLLRNYAAYYLGRQLDGMDFSPIAKIVDVYFNGIYMGVYQLSDQVQAGEGRVNVVWDEDPDVSEFLFERCFRVRSEGVQNVDWIDVNGEPIGINDSRARIPGHIESLRNFLIHADNIIMGGDWKKIQEVVHIESAIDFYIVQELFLNMDVAHTSVRMQARNINGTRKLVFGPVWDFDAAAGNIYRHGLDQPTGMFANHANRWLRGLNNVSEFKTLAARRFHEVAHYEVQQMIDVTLEKAMTYKSSFNRNFEVWPIWGMRFVDHGTRVIRSIHSHIGQVEHLTNWFESRRDWMYNYFKNYV